MSWLLGERYSKQHQNISDHIQNDKSNVDAGDSVNQPPNNTKPPAQMDSYEFDASGFEKAASAMKELQKSRMKYMSHKFVYLIFKHLINYSTCYI